METVGATERVELLDRAVSRATMKRASLVSRGQYEAVIEFGKLPPHILHLLLTLVTFGLWGIVWLIDTLTSGVKRRTVKVDEYGQTWISKGAGWEPY